MLMMMGDYSNSGLLMCWCGCGAARAAGDPDPRNTAGGRRACAAAAALTYFACVDLFVCKHGGDLAASPCAVHSPTKCETRTSIVNTPKCLWTLESYALDQLTCLRIAK